MPSDLEQLLDMGFPQELAELALKQAGNLNGAMDWIEANQDKPIDEIKSSLEQASKVQPLPESSSTTAADAVARSLKCDECGRLFRDQTSASAHAERTGHDEFSQSADEVPPLTEEEKNTKLAELRERLAAKRAEETIKEKDERKRNEQIRMKNTKATQDAKEDMKRKEQIKAAEAKRKEKEQDRLAKEKIREKIQKDKEERRQKAEQEKAARAGIHLAAAEPAPPPAPVSKPAAAYTETRLRLQTTSKGNVIVTLPVDTTLYEVALALEGPEHGCPTVQSFTQTFPRKSWDRTEERTLKELGLIPSASLLVK